MALVLVLGMLVLVAVLVVAFLSSVSTELQSAKSYASGSDARALADTAVNVVISQIQDATSQPTLAWASQPGMIRTYNSNGNAVTAYKLYSSSLLQHPGNFDAIANTTAEVPADWRAKENVYTDLNEPVTAQDGNHYPIISPAAVHKDVSGGPSDIALDGSTGPIEGCFIDSTNPAVGAEPTHVPMPVQWLYILKNGNLAAMDPVTQKIPITPATLPDGSANTVVGRVAFWTDDETCKVNINTASEGTFWDRPWTSSNPSGGYESSLTQRIPAQNEYQRFPGHPAMTCLSTVFPMQNGETQVQYNSRLYGILPRVADGGTISGTTAVNYLTPPIVPDADRLFASVDEFIFGMTRNSSGVRNVNPKNGTVPFVEGEIEKSRFFLTANSRAPEVNLFNKPRITLWPLQANTSNISDPESAAARNSKDRLIAFCSTIGSGANSKPYYFQRYNTYDYSRGGPNDRGTGNYNPAQNPPPSSQSPIMDWNLIPRNQELYTYLQQLTSAPVPGLGGQLGGSTPAKYNSSTRDQIVTELFDYIRSNFNITSTGIATLSGGGYSYAPFNPGYSGNTGSWTGQFQIVPLSLPNGTKGFGQFTTITQAALVFFRTDNLLVNGAEQTSPSAPYPGILPAAAVTAGTAPKMRAMLLLQPFVPTPGPPPWSANMRISIEGLNRFEAAGVPLNFPSVAVNLVNARDGQSNATPFTGLELFTQYWPLRYKRPGTSTVGAADEEQYYPFVSNEIAVPGSAFAFRGGEITIKIYSGYANSLNDSDLVQTIKMDFPDGTGWPVPDIAWSRSEATKENEETGEKEKYTTFTQYNKVETRFGALQGGGYGVQQNGQHNPLPLIVRSNGASNTGDTVRAIEARFGGPARGDFRMIAGLQNVPTSLFNGRGLKDSSPDGKSYNDSAKSSRLLHSLRVDSGAGQGMTSFSGGYYTGAGVAGKLLAAANYYASTGNPNKAHRAPAVPYGLTQATMADGTTLGDWDTGISSRRDGPFVNKADLGNVGSNATVTNGHYGAQGFDRSANDAIVVDTGASFSPNRQVSSAVSFGSLPTGIDPASPDNAKPWQTLLFCKNPLGGDAHPGFGSPVSGPPYTKPPDHVFLDLFTMPIVEPYAISEPFSTAGKVNMNYQIVPFTYLTRSTGVRAVLKSTRMMAIPTSAAINYKYDKDSGQSPSPGYPPDFRYSINPDEKTGTLAGFQERFAHDIFRSASEICSIYLVPGTLVNSNAAAPGSPTYSTMNSWWNTYQLTGDNVREQPYGHIYPRLTTKSNTFTVHVRAQALKKGKRTSQDEFVDGVDQVTGEYRGSFIVQRTLDPNSDSLVKADGSPTHELDPEGMVGPYKYRVLSTKRFAP